MVRVKAPAMRAKSKDELLKQLEDLKTELSTLQVCVHGVYLSYLLFHVPLLSSLTRFDFGLFSRLNILFLTASLHQEVAQAVLLGLLSKNFKRFLTLVQIQARGMH